MPFRAGVPQQTKWDWRRWVRVDQDQRASHSWQSAAANRQLIPPQPPHFNSPEGSWRRGLPSSPPPGVMNLMICFESRAGRKRGMWFSPKLSRRETRLYAITHTHTHSRCYVNTRFLCEKLHMIDNPISSTNHGVFSTNGPPCSARSHTLTGAPEIDQVRNVIERQVAAERELALRTMSASRWLPRLLHTLLLSLFGHAECKHAGVASACQAAAAAALTAAFFPSLLWRMQLVKWGQRNYCLLWSESCEKKS